MADRLRAKDDAHLVDVTIGDMATTQVDGAFRLVYLVYNTSCNRTRLEFDHRTPWAQTHHTRIHDLQGPCHFHHRQKTVHACELVDGTGKRPVVPPHDPRHPNHTTNNKAPP
ncbi:MAG TPA: hypothetical protein VHI95_01110 [Acidimicrobiales bacterium]|nr:hypothetical protein [Acidimicrobiales bacterium]